jgi:hypothetical protein
MCSQIQMTDSDVETGSAACTGIRCLRMDQELATATRGRVQLVCYIEESRPPLWSSGQSSWLLIQMSRDRFPPLSDSLRSCGSGTGFTQPREYN